MNEATQDERWEPEPLPAEEFHEEGEWANVNRAPYDEVSGVIYKRAANVKRVRYEPADPAPEMPEPFRGRGATVVRWLFSEQPGTEEGLLEGATFEFLHDTTLAAGASTGMQAHPGLDELFYVISGVGELHHRPTPGSPVVVRPLRPGDAALVRGGEYHRVANGSDGALRLMVLGLRREAEMPDVAATRG
jgi:mannose-6-phosphate isomerase-like protein (cupin superfamily)